MTESNHVAMSLLDKIKAAEGAGDTVALIAEITGIAKAVKAVVGNDCGCNKRREALNKLLPYNKGNANK